MEWTDNMHNNNGHNIKQVNVKKDYTKITFYPDLKRFNMTCLDDDIISLFYKRVYDIAGCTHKKLKVYLNNELIKIKDLKEYADL